MFVVADYLLNGVPDIDVVSNVTRVEPITRNMYWFDRENGIMHDNPELTLLCHVSDASMPVMIDRVLSWELLA